jgi:arylsulfatase A-like enzyme
MENNKKPNIILISIDALRADHLGFMGYGKNISPNIDNLAKQSVVFGNAFSVGPVTPYSFPSILTSTYPLDYQGPNKIKKPRILISEILKKNGYITAAFHSTPYLSDYFGYNKGWDFFEDITPSIGYSPQSFLKKAFERIIISTFPQLFFRLAYLKYIIKKPKKTKVSASFINRIVKDFIYSFQNKKKPFFLWIHYMDVHTPPACYFKNRACSYSELIGDYVSSAIRTYGNKGALKKFIKNNFRKYIEKTICSYDQAIESLDKEIGEMLIFLKKNNIYQNSIICLISDHGDEFLEHEGVGHNIQLYNEVLHVPLLIRVPKEKSGMIKDKVSLIDLSPTLCNLAGVKSDAAFKGKDLFNQNDDFIFHQAGFSKTGCQTDRWKYILDSASQTEELYNLLEDPKEQNNLSEKEPEVLAEMRKAVRDFEKNNPPLSMANKI